MSKARTRGTAAGLVCILLLAWLRGQVLAGDEHTMPCPVICGVSGAESYRYFGSRAAADVAIVADIASRRSQYPEQDGWYVGQTSWEIAGCRSGWAFRFFNFYRLIWGVIRETSPRWCFYGYSATPMDACAVPIGPPEAKADVDYGQNPADTAYPLCRADRVGDPISVFNGNVYESQEDLRVTSPFGGGFGFARAYNSRHDQDGPLGVGWTHTYNLMLDPDHAHEGQTYLRIIDETGRGVYFQAGRDGSHAGAFNETAHVTVEGHDRVWHRSDDLRYVFNAQGRLVHIRDWLENSLRIAYDDQGRLATVFDNASNRLLTFHHNAENRIVAIQGPETPSIPDGIWVRYGYDDQGNLTEVAYPDGSGFSYSYTDANDGHNLTQKRNVLGNLLSAWGYDAADRAVTNLTPDGRGVTVDFADDQRVGVTDAYGLGRTFTIGRVNGRKRVTAVQSPVDCTTCGRFKRIEYDTALNVIETETANGRIDRYADHDARGNAGRTVTGFGTGLEKTVWQSHHPVRGRPLNRTEPSVLGPGVKQTIWDYDDDGNQTANENPTMNLHRLVERGFTRNSAGEVVALERVIGFSYTAKGQLASIDGPLPGDQDVVRFTYDETTGDLLSVTRPLIGATVYSHHDGAGRPGRITDVNNRACLYTYDARGRVVQIQSTVDATAWGYRYDGAGRLTAATAPNGVTVSFSYDATDGRLSEMADAMGNRIRYAYDAAGNVSAASYWDPSGARRYWAGFDYGGPDHSGRLYRRIQADGSFSRYDHDSAGRLVQVTDPAGRISRYTHDVLDRLNQAIQPGNAVTGFAYDSQDNLIRATDADGKSTFYEHDDFGRLLIEVSPDSGVTRRVYDEADNLVHKTDANGVGIDYIRDVLGRPWAIVHGDGSVNAAFGWDQGVDAIGRLCTMTDASGSYHFRYNHRGELVHEQKDIGNVRYHTHYAYDAAGLLTRVIYPDGRGLVYAYDGAGRVAKLTTVKDGVAEDLVRDIVWHPFGPLAGYVLGSGQNAANGLDQNYRPVQKTVAGFQQLDYTVDPAGTITAIENGLVAGQGQRFAYDNLDRLIQAVGGYGTIGYTYDAAGNRLSRDADGTSETYRYDPGTNRLVSVSGAGDRQFAHDAAGNTLAAGDLQLAWNPNNRLEQASHNGRVLGRYVYNAFAQRIKKITDQGETIHHWDVFGKLIGESDTNGRWFRTYVYLEGEPLALIDMPPPVGLDQVIGQLGGLCGAGSVPSGGDLTGSGHIDMADPLLGLQVLSGLRPLPERLYYYINDHLGTPQKIVSPSGTVVWQADATPFGGP